VIALTYKTALPIICLLASASALGTAATGRPHTLKAQVRFLATSTSVHGGLGTSQDVYLVEVTPRGPGETILARLVDEYPPYRVMLSPEILTSSEGSTLKIRRDKNCDTAFGLMLLRTAPGDPIAILPERLGFEPRLSTPVEPNAVLPCYRTVR
jgi:hypothetical protein